MDPLPRGGAATRLWFLTEDVLGRQLVRDPFLDVSRGAQTTPRPLPEARLAAGPICGAAGASNPQETQRDYVRREHKLRIIESVLHGEAGVGQK